MFLQKQKIALETYTLLSDSVPIESDKERASREADQMAVIDAVGDDEADPNVMLE